MLNRVVEEFAGRSAIQRCEKIRSDWKKIGRQTGNSGCSQLKYCWIYTQGVWIAVIHTPCV